MLRAGISKADILQLDGILSVSRAGDGRAALGQVFLWGIQPLPQLGQLAAFFAQILQMEKQIQQPVAQSTDSAKQQQKSGGIQFSG